MATPVVADTFTGQTTANGTNHSVTLPAAINRGDLLIMFCTSDGNPTMTPPTGWTEIMTEVANSTLVSVAVFAKSADGTEDGASVTWTTGASEQTSTVGYRITGWGGTLADIAFGTAVTGASTTPNPPNVNHPNWGAEDYLFIGFGGNDHGSRTLSSGITGYTGTFNASTGVGGCATYAAYLAAAATASADPGTWTISTSDDWVANTCAIIGSKILFTEDFEGRGTGPSDGTAMSATNTFFELFNGVGSRLFNATSPPPNNGSFNGEFTTSGTGQALVKDNNTLPGTVNGGVAQKQLWFRGYFRTGDSCDIDDRIVVFEQSAADGGADIAVIRWEATGQSIEFLDGTTLRTTMTHAIGGHTHWHRIEMWLDQNTDYYEIRIWWAGDKDSTDTGATNYESTSGTFSNNGDMQVWGIGNFSGITGSIYMDDIAVGIGGWIGPAAVSAQPTSEPPHLLQVPKPAQRALLVR